MSKIDKAKERLSLCPKDYTYSEAKYLLTQLGFQEFNKGKMIIMVRQSRQSGVARSTCPD